MTGDRVTGDRVAGFPWPVGAATGVGSMPGTDIGEAVATVLGELPDLPHLPELPDRGAGADMIGRTAGLLVEFPVELYVGRWRVAGRPGRDLRGSLDLWHRDLDALTERTVGLTGPLKVQATGPWTFAASVDLPIGGRLLRDPGAVRDLTASLAEGLRAHVDEVRKRVPGADVVLQLDEPSLPAVLAGRVPSESGLHTLRTVTADTAQAALRSIVESVEVPVIVHCCAPEVPVRLLERAGAHAISLDLDLIDLDLVKALDPIGEFIDGGGRIFAGAVATRPPSAGRAPSSAQVADRVRGWWRNLGFAEPMLAERVVLTPACGLAGASVDHARAALRVSVEAARRLDPRQS